MYQSDEDLNNKYSLDKLTEENKQLKHIILSTIWMARRYANQRKTYAATVVNRALDLCDKYELEIQPDETLIEDGNSNDNKLDIV